MNFTLSFLDRVTTCLFPVYWLLFSWSSTKVLPVKAKSVWGCLPLLLHYKIEKEDNIEQELAHMTTWSDITSRKCQSLMSSSNCWAKVQFTL